MKQTAACLAFALAVCAFAPAAAQTQTSGHLILDARLRSESVDQDGFGKDALALTLRTRLGYETPQWGGFRVLVEGENVTALDDDYNSTTNRRTGYPVVADPEGTELNRAQITWTGDHGGAVLGRQRIILGNARFVGNVGFRQNEQTFDAIRVDVRPAKDLLLTYVYVDKVLRVFGPDSPQGEWDSRSHLFQVTAPTPVGQVNAYGQVLDLPDAPAQSSATFGARLSGQRRMGSGAVAATYELEYAHQADYAGNPAHFDLGYLALGAGVKAPAWWASLGVERLDGDGRRGFQTPLATLHAFQGWADAFLTTPAEGVRDINVKAGGVVRLGDRKLKVALAAHDFADADGAADYGRELDAVVTAPLSQKLSAEVKAARFDGKGAAFPDRTKVWVSLEFKL